MDKEEALEIISMIADGLNPYVEADPSTNLPENNPITIRAICIAITSLLGTQDREKLASNYKAKTLAELRDSLHGPLANHLKKKEKLVIRKALVKANYEEDTAASILGLELSELSRKIAEFDLDKLMFAKSYFIQHRKTGLTLDQFLGKIEIDIIQEALIKANFIKKDAAKFIGISFRSMRYKIENYKIEDKPSEPETSHMEVFKIESLSDFIKSVEIETITEALKLTETNKTEAAKLLGISFRSLRYKIEQLGIKN